MESLIGQLLVALVVIGALSWMLRAAVPTRAHGGGRLAMHARSVGWLSRYRDSAMWSVLVIGAASLASLPAGTGLVVPASFGAAYGLGVVILTALGLHTPRDLAVGALCAIAVVVQFGQLLADDPGPVARTYRVLATLLVTAAFFVGRAVGMLLPGTRRLSVRSVLVFFAAIDALAFLASPLGVNVVQIAPDRVFFYLAAVTVGAFALGVLNFDIVVALAAAGVTITAVLYAGAGLGAQLSFIVSACVVAGVALLIGSLFR